MNFTKTLELSPLYKGKSLAHLKEVIIIGKPKKESLNIYFLIQKIIKNKEAEVQIFNNITKITSWMSD